METLTPLSPTEIDVRAVLRAALSNGHAPDLALLHAAPREELAQALGELSPPELGLLFTRLGDEALAEIVAELDAFDAARLLGKLGRAQAADVLEEMDPDDAADVMGELHPHEAEAILDEMEQRGGARCPPAPDLSAGERGRHHDAGLRGGGAVPDGRRGAGPARAGRRGGRDDLLRLRDRSGHRAGCSACSRCAAWCSRRAGSWSPSSCITDVTRIRADADQETAARLLDKNNYLALPVVDEQDRLLGIITADDAADVLLEEAGEDIERLGGSQPLEEPYLRASIFHLFRKRMLWLLVLFVGGAFTGSVLNHFQERSIRWSR